MTIDRSKWSRLAWPLVLVFVVGLSIAYIKPQPLGERAELSAGKYEIEAVIDDRSNLLRGPVYFEYSGKQESPLETRIFKLHLINPKTTEGPGFGFMIPLPGTDEMIEAGTYSVDQEGPGMANNFGTVLGYADMGEQTTSLYFSESGSIRILGSSPDEIYGHIDISLEDGNGTPIKVKGDFKAQHLPERIGR